MNVASKRSKCIPVFKNKRYKYDAANYRPVCIQDQSSKICEAAYSMRLISYLEQYKIKTHNQHGLKSLDQLPQQLSKL